MNARGSNQYRRQQAVPAPAAELAGQLSVLETVLCGQVWGGSCPAPVHPPSWSHGEHPTGLMKTNTAGRFDTSPAVLELLSHDPDIAVTSLVAAHRRASPAVLERLATTGSYEHWVRAANNYNTPPVTLSRLSQEPSVSVREGVANNPSTPIDALERLLRDGDPRVVKATIFNPSLPRSTLAMWQLAR